MTFLGRLSASDGAKILARTLYYAAIIGALIALHGKGDFSIPPFVYQGGFESISREVRGRQPAGVGDRLRGSGWT